MVHTAEQINGFDLPVKSWEKPLHFYFYSTLLAMTDTVVIMFTL